MRKEPRGSGKHGGTFSKKKAGKDPIKLFRQWFRDGMSAAAADWSVTNAVTFVTVGPGGEPSARLVLLQDFSENGFLFYTNYGSRKAQDITANPKGLMLYFDPIHNRQVRLSGRVEKTPADVSDRFFERQPHRNKIAAWASPQTRPIGRKELERAVDRFEKQYESGKIPRPEHWGGYALLPQEFEFWQGRPSRLHDRLLYTRVTDGHWVVERLAP